MKHIVLISITLLSLLCFGCGEENYDPLRSLEGTRWKLVGIVDETGSLYELEPKDCDKCYMLTFNMDSSFYSNSATNAIWGSYKIDYKTGNIFIRCGLMTEVGVIGDENIFVETLNIVQSFSLQRNELRLYYNDNKNYLIFKSHTS